MKTTDTILKLQKQSLPNKILNKVSSLVASLFSIIFSMSIIKETTHFIEEWYIIVILIVFIVLFLVFNEYRKVTELHLRFANCKSSLFIIILTFVVSFSLSGVGIYLWTNKTLENEIQNDKTIVSEHLSIENRYNTLIDSINALNLSENEEYIQLKINLKYWEGRSAANLEERTYIREQIEKSQSTLLNFYSNFKSNKDNKIKRYSQQKEAELSNIKTNFNNNKKFINRANKISFIFFLMVIITELIIILLAKEYSSNTEAELKFSKGKIETDFLNQYRTITDILMRKNKIEFNDVIFSPYLKFSKDEHKRTKEVKSIFYLFGDLGICELPLKEAQLKLKNYYETTLNF